ncbi:DUF5794 domain-containing protein [Salinirubrum litoreum]|uniref:DUF5794 domain-containing protein n=1 Tax=Salinirubrum litoreum TaxID=1126234 RepID=A0ABD5RB92_9EURY|nr:DUF5794 domain-containing protein [Salinirubrum litoreum]
MSVSQHPIALRLERQVGGATKLLATVMALPLVDGIFPAMILAGAVATWTGVVEVGLLIFGGSATVAVILADMEGTRREQVTAVLTLGLFLIPLAAVEAALAPTLDQVIDTQLFHRFAGLVILSIAAKTASAEIGEYLPRPGIIIGLGLVAALQMPSSALVFEPEAMQVVRGAAAAGVGVGFALLVALLGPRLRGAVDLDLFRFGSAVALGVLALSVSGVWHPDAPVALGVMGVTALFALDRGVADGSEEVPQSTDDVPVSDVPSPEPTGVDPEAPEYGPVRPEADAMADGGDDESDETGYGYPGEDESRAPWL